MKEGMRRCGVMQQMATLSRMSNGLFVWRRKTEVCLVCFFTIKSRTRVKLIGLYSPYTRMLHGKLIETTGLPVFTFRCSSAVNLKAVKCKREARFNKSSRNWNLYLIKDWKPLLADIDLGIEGALFIRNISYHCDSLFVCKVGNYLNRNRKSQIEARIKVSVGRKLSNT